MSKKSQAKKAAPKKEKAEKATRQRRNGKDAEPFTFHGLTLGIKGSAQVQGLPWTVPVHYTDGTGKTACGTPTGKAAAQLVRNRADWAIVKDEVNCQRCIRNMTKAEAKAEKATSKKPVNIKTAKKSKKAAAAKV